MLRSDDIARLDGALILDAGGQPVGTVQHVYQNPTTGNPVWVSVTANPGAPRVFISLVRATWNPTSPNTLEVVFTSSAIAGSPLIEATEQLSSADITTLAGYYQEAFTVTHETGVEDDHGFTAQPVIVTRSEEQARIRTLSVPVERVRVRKVIVTEEKQITVTIRREELRIDRSPIDPPTRDTSPPQTQRPLTWTSFCVRNGSLLRPRRCPWNESV